MCVYVCVCVCVCVCVNVGIIIMDPDLYFFLSKYEHINLQVMPGPPTI